MMDFPFIEIIGGAPTPALISRTLGTVFGNMTAGSGIAAAFNGTTSQASSASASISGGGPGYVGKDWGSGVTKTVTSAKVYGSNNVGFTLVAANATVNIYGSNTSPASATNGTLLGTSGSFADAANAIANITVSSPQAFRYNWATISGAGESFGLVCAEVEFTGY